MKHVSDTQLVITVPDPDGSQIAHDVKARTTLGVLTTLIAQSQKTLVLAAPFFQQNEGLNQEPLAGALIGALKRGVIVDFASTKAGLDTLDREMLRSLTSSYIRFFQSTINYEDASKLGLHAKFCIADNSLAYIGSANLTKPGLYQHFEMGVLVKGDVAQQTGKLWEYLIDKQFFVEVI
jgi:phosphatidylserine/phosphatidylglycerophosphate/cardiolipin synthase-like enzyme